MTHPPASARLSFWQRRVRGPIVALFTQGITPDKVALTLAVGTACSLFPFLGFTSLLNLGVGLWLRLNQPLLQTLNYLLTVPHLLMIVVYVRIGEGLWRMQDDRFSVAEMLRVFREATIGEFLQRFGWAGVHAFTAWALTAPLLIAVIYFAVRPALRRLAGSRELNRAVADVPSGV
ncbi:DUF2062 domain-containing protein [Oleiharenicola lentus]|uniref:DUF2062 domain-containing protein n=1 Tax=Oleiharenicola lentus TaxID=2508720 RepID=UPI0013E9821D|nr:DUF2062 domain-containing protein [Oleiharenicola lentus]